MNKFDELIPELPKWNNGKGILLGDWITCIGRYDHFLGYLELIWPNFIVVDDIVFIESLWDKARYASINLNSPDKSDIQKYLNLIDLTSLFFDADEQVSDELLIHLAKSISDAWKSKLEKEYPERNFKVVIGNTLNDPEECELNIFFYETEI